MPMNIRRLIPGLTATAGGLLATAFLSSAFAHADVITYDIIPDPEDGPSQLSAVGGFPPFDETVSYTGLFAVNEIGAVGNATYYSDVFGVHNVLLQFDSHTDPNALAGVIDQTTFGSGWENVYTDFHGAGFFGTDGITDNLITPFGDFNIPTTFDALATFPAPVSFAAVDTDFGSFVTALDADWTTLVTDFSALF
jgi:hypothetical protein